MRTPQCVPTCIVNVPNPNLNVVTRSAFQVVGDVTTMMIVMMDPTRKNVLITSVKKINSSVAQVIVSLENLFVMDTRIVVMFPMNLIVPQGFPEESFVPRHNSSAIIPSAFVMISSAMVTMIVVMVVMKGNQCAKTFIVIKVVNFSALTKNVFPFGKYVIMKMIVVMDPMKIIILSARSGLYLVYQLNTSVPMIDVFLLKKFVIIKMIAVTCPMKKDVIKESVRKRIVVDVNTIVPLSLNLVTFVFVHEDTKYHTTAPRSVKTSMNVHPLDIIALKFVSI